MLSFRRAFTLVELLVVVSILTLLVAILLPVVSLARRRAQQVKCAANLRSIGQALTMYTQQYGYYPGCTLVVPAKPAVAIWPVRLRSFMGDNQETFYCPAQDVRCRWENVPREPGRAGRATPFEARFGYDLGEPLLDDRRYFSYGYNAWGSDGSYGQTARGLGDVYAGPRPTPDDMAELRATRVKVPEDMIAIADSTADGLYDWFIKPHSNPSAAHTLPGNVHPSRGPHRGGSNVLFCDGHVQWYRQEDISFDSYAADWSPFAVIERMWNYDHRRTYGN